MTSSNNKLIHPMLAVIKYQKYINVHVNVHARKAETHTHVIQLTANHTLAFENDLLNIPTCMINFTYLQLD